MKKILLLLLAATLGPAAFSQTIYYWVGGAASANINTGANWNTSLNGSGSTRPSSTGANDILVFDGSNLGGATPVTGPIIVNANAGITAAQLKFTNNATVSFIRSTTGTTTITLNGGTGDDFVIDAGSNFSITSNTGSVVIAMAATNTGRVGGNFSMVTTLQARIANTTGGTPGSLIFEPGSTFTTNMTPTSAAYAFGTSTQSSEKWVVFQAGSHLYYDGGFSPWGNNSTFSPIEFLPGSYWHHRANNPATGFGTFAANKSFANIVVENGAVFAADGSINRIDTLNVTSGSGFIEHSAGSTVIRGNLVVDGSFTTPTPLRNNTVVMNGNVLQSISGSGTINMPALVIADGASVQLNRNLSGMDSSVVVYGQLNFNGFQLSGPGSFATKANAVVTGLTGTLTAGSNQVTAVAGTITNLFGLSISGAGIPAGTVVTNFSAAGGTINLSNAATASGTSVVLTLVSDTAVLATSNSNGFDPATGSVIMTGGQNFAPGTGYIINGATTKPFGISTGSTAGSIAAGSVVINAAATTNITVDILGNLQLNAAKLTIRAGDTVHLLPSAVLLGNFGNNTYIATASNPSGAQGVLRMDNITAGRLFPVGSASNYLPATITPSAASDFAVSAFEGITANGLPNGTALSAAQKQTKVDAVWNIARINGSGSAQLQLKWPQSLEGSTFATLPGADIGIITNSGSSWNLPTAPGDNTNNTASNSYSVFGAFSVGAQPPAQAFLFNPLPAKTYGDLDFDGGAISANTTQPIIYSSSNAAVATIVNNKIHIIGVGTSTITATQASDGFYPAVSATQLLTVSKASLTITADNKTKPEGDPNPPLTISYTGFVYGETNTVLSTQPTISTTAVTASPAGTYPITVSGAVAANYNINFVNGTLTVTPRQNQTITFNAIANKTYGAADFSAGATSSNTSIPVMLSSSNTSVATIVGNNIHITGAGTTTITASQAGNAFYFPATPVSRTLTVNKANLNVRVLDTVKTVGQQNPPFTIVMTGFVLGETAAVLTTAPTASTTAGTNTPPGSYIIEVGGGVSSNYNFVYTNGRLVILPASGTTVPYMQTYMSGPSELTVKVFSPAPDLGNIYLYDMAGRLVMQKNVFFAQGFLSHRLGVMVPASGIYVVKVVGSTVNLKMTVPIVK